MQLTNASYQCKNLLYSSCEKTFKHEQFFKQMINEDCKEVFWPMNHLAVT